MGQGQSSDAPPPTLGTAPRSRCRQLPAANVVAEQLSLELTRRFAEKCYTPLEIYCYKAVFRSLADSSSGIRYWSEPTLCRFLALPDALAVGSVVFQMASYLGAFPFPSQAPAILTSDNLLKVITLLTRRHTPVLGKKGDRVWISELYRSLAVYDRGLQAATAEGGQAHDADAKTNDAGSAANGYDGFAIDAPGDDEGEEDEDDELVLAALDSMDAIDVFKQGEKSNLHHSIIPTDNFLRLIQLLLFVAPLEAQDDLAVFGLQLTDKRLKGLRETANNILSSFGIEKSHGVNYKTFHAVVSSSLPYLFDGLNPLFEHFLFAKDFDLSKRKGSTADDKASAPPASPPPVKEMPAPEPILLSEGEILDLNVVSQLSFIIKGNNLFRRLRPLYSGGTHGFSLGSFEKSVFNWRAPSILLVSGSLLPDTPSNPSERAFADSLPHKRLPSSLDLPSASNTSSNQTLVFGAYIPVPWKGTPKTCFGDASTLLFQLSPTHDLLHASALAGDYVYFNKPPHHPSGIGLGSGVPQAGASRASHSRHSSAHHAQHVPLGPVSLHLDAGLEFGIFTHLAEGAGSFLPSENPGRRARSWQDRFAIEAIEVWGCGGDEEAEQQRKAWAWEEREAEARRRINLGTGDIEADRELLKLAGILQERSGGSM